MKRLGLLLIPAFIGIAVCGGGSKAATADPSVGSGAGGSGETSYSTPSTQPTPVRASSNDLESAKQRYLAIVEPNNKAIHDVIEKRGGVNANITADQVPGYCAELAPITDAFAHKMAAATWPTAVQQQAADLTQALASAAGLMYTCSHDTNPIDGLRNYNTVQDAAVDVSKASSTMRLALGLPLDKA